MAGANRVVIDGVSYPIDDATAVDFEEQQTLTDAQKTQARSNIGAASQDDMTSVQAAVGNVPSGNNLQDEVTDLKSAIDDVVGAVSDSISIGMSSDLVIRGLINTSNLWSTSSGFYSYALSVNAGQYHSITVTAGENNAIIGILASSTLVNQQTPPFCGGVTSRIVVPVGTTAEISIPSDCTYIVIMKEANSIDYTPASVILNGWKTIPAIDETLTVQGDAADAKATGDKFAKYDSILYKNQSVNFSSEPEKKGIIGSSTQRWSIKGDNMSYFIPVYDDYDSITVTAGETLSVVALLKTNTVVHATVPDYATGGSRVTIQAGESQTFNFPNDCNYICIMKTADETDYTPASAIIKVISIDGLEDAIVPLGLHEMPSSKSALNIVKRCRQLTDIKWTPAVDLPRFMLVQRGGDIPNTAVTQNYFGTFIAGTEYTGIPYGRVSNTMSAYGYDYATVAHYIPLETFVSSVCNPESKLCKEDVHNLGGHRSVLYATVCSGLTCYALNVPEVPTASIQSISGLAQIGKINDNGTEISDSSFQIGDVLNLAGYHTAIVTDIIRDADGTIQSIELSDASTAGLADRNYSDGQIGGVCRRKGWTRAQIYDPYSWGGYTLCRYTGNVPYTPSQYVNVGDEFNMQRIEHFPCMPYEGNKFVYKTGYIPNNAIKILVSLSGYGYLKVFKNGTEISGSPFTVTDETASIDVSEISAGVYKAYLCNITDGNVVNLTYPCEWTISE